METYLRYCLSVQGEGLKDEIEGLLMMRLTRQEGHRQDDDAVVDDHVANQSPDAYQDEQIVAVQICFTQNETAQRLPILTWPLIRLDVPSGRMEFVNGNRLRPIATPQKIQSACCGRTC